MKLRHSARTDVGQTRDHNEDNYGVGEGEQVERLGELLVVCDGMGGHAAGEVASRVAVETILSLYYQDDAEDRRLALEHVFTQANTRIYTQGRGTMGTTGVAALLHQDSLHVANVGDSRAYLIRDGEIRQISRDHSFVNDQVAAGLITPEQARSSPHRNVITRALGYQSDVTVDLFRLPLQTGDIILLSSDGLHGLITDAEIQEIVTTTPIDQATERLINLSNQRGGPDNITVIIATVDVLDWETPPLSDEEKTNAPRQTLLERTISQPLSTTAAATPPAPTRPIGTPEQPILPLAPTPHIAERRLTLLGGVLATLLLTILVIVILVTLNQPTPTNPTSTPNIPANLTPRSTYTISNTPSTIPLTSPTTPRHTPTR